MKNFQNFLSFRGKLLISPQEILQPILRKSVFLVSLVSLTGISTLGLNSQGLLAASCTEFPVVGGEGTEVTKTVAQPAVPSPYLGR